MVERKFFVTKDELERSYRELGSMDAVADKYGVSKKLVLVYMKRFKIERNKGVQPSEVQKLVEEGRTSKEIAIKLGVRRERVNQICKKLGISATNPYHKGFITHNGYRLIKRPDHSLADKKGYVPEHRIIMEKHIGYVLSKDRLVHHVNGIKDDNRIENLAIMSEEEHVRLHHVGKNGRGPDKKKRKNNKPPRSCEFHHTEKV